MLNEPLTIITLIEGNKRNFDTANIWVKDILVNHVESVIKFTVYEESISLTYFRVS